MLKFKIYAGLGGGFGGAQYHGIYEFTDAQEADRYAYDLAWEEYESYAGYHGLSSWDDVREELVESGEIPDGELTSEQAEIVNEYYIEEAEGWMTWYTKPVDNSVIDCDDTYDEDLDDDDADCYCE